MNLVKPIAKPAHKDSMEIYFIFFLVLFHLL
jgi:hypothetical protein